MIRTSRLYLVLLLVSLCADSAISQSSSSLTWIFFKDRGSAAVDVSALSPNVLGISKRALWRRAKVLPPGRLIDERDLPVAAENIDAIRATGARIRATSRWFNAVSIEATPNQLQACRQLPFVQHSQPVALSYRRKPEVSVAPPLLRKRATAAALDYGLSITQIENINAVGLHDLGINGYGVIVGMVDDGYNNHRVHEAMKDIRVLAEYDFIQRDSNTSVEPGENASRGSHGALTLSTLAGFKEGELIGAAYGASLLLAKTEVAESETQIEEDYYVEGLEWLDSLGADIISSSLGYIDWYDYDDLDGNTAVTTQAARILAQRGILLVTAMGNEQHFRTFDPNSTGTLIAPADADSIIAVGAVASNNIIASFSSTGPTFDGRIKPEVVAQGVSVRSAIGSTISNYAFVNGTSLSTPLTAGAAALVLSAHPELTPMQIREALIETAQQVNDPQRAAEWPNNYYGWGKVDAYAAVLYHGLVFSNKPVVAQSGGNLIITTAIVPNPSTPLTGDSLFLYYRAPSETEFQRVPLSPTGQQNMYSASVAATDSVLEGYFSARDNSGAVRTNPYDAPNSLLTLEVDSNQTGIPPNPTIPDKFILHANYPNPFNSGTIIRFDAPQVVEVELAIYNVLGQKIRTLFRGLSTQGTNQYSWDGTVDGVPTASGVYFSRLTTPTTTLTGKMVYIR
ncbi:MAG: S8 family serine peptidase [Ignavibacteriae bacterium]|nr:S8 family serine peptidase [Ignavibacteriota bacterium]